MCLDCIRPAPAVVAVPIVGLALDAGRVEPTDSAAEEQETDSLIQLRQQPYRCVGTRMGRVPTSVCRRWWSDLLLSREACCTARSLVAWWLIIVLHLEMPSTVSCSPESFATAIAVSSSTLWLFVRVCARLRGAVRRY